MENGKFSRYHEKKSWLGGSATTPGKDGHTPMRRYLPSFAALQCFEAAARHLNFTRAAEELHLTQSAVSRQIRNLEDFLQQALFQRTGKRLVLTDAGRAYADDIAGQLDRMEASTISVMTGSGGGGVLTVGTLPTFGARWLVPRLHRFAEAHPDLQLNIVTSLRPFDFTDDGVDAAVQRGEGAWPGHCAHLLLDEEIIAVASPALVPSGKDLAAESVTGYPLLQQATRLDSWPRWPKARGATAADRVHGPCFEHFSMLIEAGLTGMGVAVVPTVFVASELDGGRLMAPFGPAVATGQGYYLVYPESRAQQPAVTKLRDWLISV